MERQMTPEDLSRMERALQRIDALLLDLEAPSPADLTLRRLHGAVVGGLVQCSRLGEQLFGEVFHQDTGEEGAGECA